MNGIYKEISGNQNLLVSFGGINNGLGVPVFEFFNLIKDLRTDKLFMRDLNQGWYHKGIGENIPDIEALSQFLCKEIEDGNFKNVVFIGNSMGGYIAMLLGTLLKVDYILVFAPQSYIDPLNRLLTLDFRWSEQVRKVYKSEQSIKKYFDIKKLLKSQLNSKSKIDIYYSKSHRLDCIHAERLRNIENIELHPCRKGGHAVVKALRDSGDLLEIVGKTLK